MKFENLRAGQVFKNKTDKNLRMIVLDVQYQDGHYGPIEKRVKVRLDGLLGEIEYWMEYREFSVILPRYDPVVMIEGFEL